jgi:uncharacterized damage-inducible protein DinB
VSDVEETVHDGTTLHAIRLKDVDLTRLRVVGGTMRDVLLRDVEISDAEVSGVSISGDVLSLEVNGVDVVPYVEAELDRREPLRVKMRPTDPAGFREAWDLLEELWADTVARARRLPPEQLHESVDGEWSFVQTLRHLAFASESWVLRGIEGEPRPWDPLSLPWDDVPEDIRPAVPHDREARPTLEEALALRERVQAEVRRVIDSLTEESLAADGPVVDENGWPPPGRSFPVKECLLITLSEEWHHRKFAERDLAVLEQPV